MSSLAKRLFVVGSIFLGVLLFNVIGFGQTDQVRHLAYSTYNPQPGDATLLAANSAGEVCLASDELYKLNPDGSLAYDKPGVGGLVATDSAGDCYLVTGGYQNNPPTTVTKYDPHGNLLSTLHYTGSGTNGDVGIEVDGSGNVWLAGLTNSNDLQLVNPIQGMLKGTYNLFIAEFNSAGTLIFSTYLGGSGTDTPTALALDASGNAYITGYTTSTDFPLLNPLESSPPPPNNFSAFLTKVSSTGQLLYSTYLGTTVGAFACGVATDTSGDMFVTGQIVTSGKPFTTVVKLNPAGSAVLYKVVPTLPSFCSSIAVDSQGNAYTSAGFQPLINPIQSDATDWELGALDPNGNVVFATYLGNSSGSQPGEAPNFPYVGVDSAGNVYADMIEDYYEPVPIVNSVNGAYPFYPICVDGFCPHYPTFVAKIALGAGPSFSMPTIVDFPATAVGSTSPIPINIYNTGTTSIDISSISISGDYSQTNNCPLNPSVLNPGTTCSINIVFAPTISGTRTGAATIFDDSPGNPHVIPLTGAGSVPGATVNPSSVNFAPEQVGDTTNPQIAMLTNTGNATLNITRVAITGDFGETNNCTQLGSNQSCTFSITFTPTMNGTRNGTVTITDNAANSPQMISLTGTGTGGTGGSGLGVASGSSGSATVSAGATASYTLTIGGQGMSGTAMLNCTGAPTGATCTVPASENVSGTSASSFPVTITTMARSSGLLVGPHSSLEWMWATGVFAMLLLPSAARKKGKRIGVLPFALLLFVCSCGGGSSSLPAAMGTPPGTYTVTVKATMGSASSSVPLTLIVQ